MFSVVINFKEIYIHSILDYILKQGGILLGNIYNILKSFLINLNLALVNYNDIINIKNIVNCLTNLFNTHSNTLDVVPFSEYSVEDFVSSIFECYRFNKIIDVNYNQALALEYARNHTDLDIRLNVYKTLHIKKAVKITIYTLNELVAIIPKYFSIVYFDSEMLFGVLCFGKIASFSYGIGESISLGLTLVVV